MANLGTLADTEEGKTIEIVIPEITSAEKPIE